MNVGEMEAAMPWMVQGQAMPPICPVGPIYKNYNYNASGHEVSLLNTI